MTVETPRAQVLIVEDEADHADVMADALRKPGHVSTIVNTVDDAYEELSGGAFDIVITDLRMPSSAGHHGTCGDGADAGLRVLEGVRTLQPMAETIMVTAHGDVGTARTAFKQGVFDFIEKPLDLEVFRSLVNRAAETVLLRHETVEDPEAHLDELVQHEGFKGIIAGSEPMRKILHTVKTMGASSLPVLVTGESGTGKELIARALHNVSSRSKKRFVALNCAAETESLLEDQLFGHVKGAYTGAEKDREGVFEYANGGTLFLDEIGDMPASMQAKLLRVLETGEVVRLGSNDPRSTDVRLVSATNKDLDQAVRDESFREDLFFRIAGATIHLPPLRERRDDIPRIIRHAIAEFVEKTSPGTSPMDITDAALVRLTSYHWPGNVRQLLNVVQNMVVQALAQGGGTLDTQHIPDSVRSGDEPEESGASVGSLAGASLQQLEKRAIRETLRLTNGNREQAANLLGIGERTLYRKLKEFGLR
ncbi:MAG: sigma-54-dependent transcriptional regulator [Phycisphaerales bacterium JB043]